MATKKETRMATEIKHGKVETDVIRGRSTVYVDLPVRVYLDGYKNGAPEFQGKWDQLSLDLFNTHLLSGTWNVEMDDGYLTLTKTKRS